MAWKPPESDKVQVGWQPPEADQLKKPTLMERGKNILSQYQASPYSKMSILNMPQTASNAVQNIFGTLGEKTATKMAVTKNPITGQNFSPITSAAAGTVVGMIPDVATTLLSGEPKSPTKALTSGEIPAPKIEPTSKTAQNLAMKAAGYSKRFINNEPRISKARDSVQQMMDEGVFKPFSSTEPMVERADQIAQDSGKRIGQFLKSIGEGGKVISREKAVTELDSLRPVGDDGQALKGGVYDILNGKIDRAIDTLKAHGDKITFETANQVKGLLQNLANFSKTDAMGLMDRVIAGKFRDFLDNSLEQVSSAAGKAKEFQGFLKDKKLYSSALNIVDPLYNRLSSELGNKGIGLTDWIVAAAQMGHGNILGAVGTVGAKKALEGMGPQTGAYLLNKAAKIAPKITINPLIQTAAMNTAQRLVNRRKQK